MVTLFAINSRLSLTRFYYIRHRYLDAIRSYSSGKAWIVGALLVIFGLQIGFGIYLSFEEVLFNYQRHIGIENRSSALISLFVVFLLIDTLVKLYFNPVPLRLKEYILLPIRPFDIAISYQLVSVFSPIQIGLLLVSFPVMLRFSQFIPEAWMIFGLVWLMTHYLSVSLHHLDKRIRLGFILLIGLLLVGHFYGLIALELFSLSIKVLVVLLIAALTTSVWVINNYIQSYQNLDAKKDSWLEDWLMSFSFKSALMQLEWSLISRNKRSRSNLLVGAFALIYLFFIFFRSESEADALVIFVVVIGSTGLLMLQHGIYTLAWEGNYFDSLFSRISFKEFVWFKYRLFVISSLISFAILVPVALIKPTFFPVFVTGTCYNIGVNTLLILNGMTANTNRLDLDRSTVFNYQGFNGTLFVNSILVMLLPVVLFAVFRNMLGEVYAYLFLLAMGLSGIVVRKKVLALIVNRVKMKKYRLAQGYRS